MEYFIERLRTELETDEGCRYLTYLDHLGLLTGGIGHLIKGTDEEYGKPIGTAIPKERVAEWFEQDIQIAMDETVRLICCNMMFNLGYPRYCKFKLMIQAIKDGNHIEAGNQMRQSKWHKQVTNRADRLISRMQAVKMS